MQSSTCALPNIVQCYHIHVYMILTRPANNLHKRIGKQSHIISQ